MIPHDMMAPLMFGGLVVFMLIGYPVSFSLAAVGLFFGFIAIKQGFFDFALMQALPERVFGILSNDTLLAIPFFTLMGAILERCGLAEDLLDGLGQLFGPVRGGLGYAVIVVGAILGAITGTVAASVIAMGLISLPVMMRYGYDKRFATGVIAASGTITQLIPPSLVLIVLADQLGRSVGDMYAGAWGPSLIQVLLFCAYTLLVSIFKPEWVPGIPAESRTMSGWPLVKRCLWGIVPSLVLIFLVLGTIFLGLATPTEGGAMGMVGAIVLAVLHRPEFSRFAKNAAWVGAVALIVVGLPATVVWQDDWMPQGMVTAAQSALGAIRAPVFVVFYISLAIVMWEAVRIAELRNLIKQASQSTMRLTAMVIFILIGSTIFTLVFRGVDGDLWIEGMLLHLPGGKIGFLIFVNLFVFFLAFFLDFFEIAFIIIPLLAPVVTKLGIDLIWFGVLLCVNMQTSFMHPPFGFALFYLRGIASREIKSSHIYWGAIPWVVLQLIMVGIVIAWPGLVTAFLDKPANVDLNKIEITIPSDEPPDKGGAPGKDKTPAPDDDLEKSFRTR
ncbi:MAG TPA: TRAP transporter large permease subunit [Burkholderiales bacterium]|nr:TRAP transporter large permease subunit [Burkholderiales bacterium]